MQDKVLVFSCGFHLFARMVNTVYLQYRSAFVYSQYRSAFVHGQVDHPGVNPVVQHAVLQAAPPVPQRPPEPRAATTHTPPSGRYESVASSAWA